VLITAECAAALAAEELDAMLARLDPIVAVVPDAGDRMPVPDLIGRVQASLGIAA
jgi:hypothetical protein